MVLPPIVVAVIWKLIYTPDISPLYYAANLLHVTMPSLTSSVDFALTASSSPIPGSGFPSPS